MNRTKIPWTDFSWSPITGCLGGCSYCYARKMAHRFGQDFRPTFHPERLDQLVGRVPIFDKEPMPQPHVREWPRREG